MNTCTPSLQRFEKVNFRRRKKTLPGPSFATKGDGMGGKHRSYPRTIESMLLWVAKCRGTLDEWTKRPWGQSASRSRGSCWASRPKNKDMRIRKPFRCPTVQCSVRNTMDGILEKELGLSSLGGYLILQDTKRMQIVPLIARHIWHRAR